MLKNKELLSPAGNFEKLRAAFLYGADAVYLASQRFGMRAAAQNFTDKELSEAISYAHSIGKKVYIAINVMPRGYEYRELRAYLRSLRKNPPDALIVADIGVFFAVKELLPDIDIHISTQASACSAAACNAWYSLGAKRVVLAREVGIEEIKAIRAGTPKKLELEAFIHGSMCVSYSGRCLLSNHYTGRDANRGMCAQPCRWDFCEKELEFYEVKRQDDIMHAHQDRHGTYIMSSKDMCMIEHIPELMQSGIDSFKIEGRMKSAYYASVVTNAYRMAIDEYNKNGAGGYVYDPRWMRELESVSHREYCTGYYFDDPMENAQLCQNPGYIREKAYIATALSYDPCSGMACFVQRNKVSRGEEAELISPNMCGRKFKIEHIYDKDGAEIESAPHPAMHFYVKVPFEVKAGDIIRGV
ncbi:MAG: U32 family peptidase [Clostridia bacterium]|nr:U32 family peptidase [Clostridia bacterium]